MKSAEIIKKINSIIKKWEKDSRMDEPGTYNAGRTDGYIRGLKMAKRIIQIMSLTNK